MISIILAIMKKRVLLAEDEQDLLTIYRMMLGDAYEVLEAQNGREAVELWRQFHPDMVLMDIQMPIMSGDAAIREILGVDPTAKILAVTAYRYTREELGVPVLSKGFGPSEFLSAVESMLRGEAA
jgi:CheY-like chemotaxis protein